MDVESFYEGYFATILVPAGETAPVGATIALIAETEAEIATAQQQAQSGSTTPAPVITSPGQTANVGNTTPTPTPASTVATAPQAESQNGASRTDGRVVASPRARKLAKELKVDLNTLKGSGPHGRIVAEDVEAFAGKITAPAVQTSPQVKLPVATPVPVSAVPGSVQPLTTLQNAVVRNMAASLQAPAFRVGYTITTDALDRLYQQIKSKGVTMTALLAKAVAVALQKHPLVNASYSEQGIVYHSNINIAVAVAMDDGGLITPVLQNADQLDIYSLSRNWKSLVDRARAKQLQPEEYNSGTFTLSNLGMFGVDRFDAILPPGQGAILAIGAARPQVVATADGMLGVRQQMQVNMTSDHRVIYGAHAAAFLQDLAKLIETNAQSLTM
jgi:pyruvate dehydrogenase E2 component (dihydrolipoamide acetyltransferase)